MSSISSVLKEACGNSVRCVVTLNGRIALNTAAKWLMFTAMFSLWKMVIYPIFIATPYFILLDAFF